MNKLKEKVNKIPNTYFSFNDLQKIIDKDKDSLKVALTRAVKSGEIVRLARGFYTQNLYNMNWENFAINLYYPSYVSFESALNKYNILSQQTMALTLATTRRRKEINIHDNVLIYRHIKPGNFWGYRKEGDYLLATKEKAFLDLAYLSLRGYAHFDSEEMNLEVLNKTIVKKYLKKFKDKKLNNLISPLLNL